MVRTSLPGLPPLRVLAVLSCGPVSRVFLAVGGGRPVVAKYASLARVQQEVAVLQDLQGAGGAPLPLAVAATPQYSPLLPGARYSFLMSDRGHVSLHGLARRHGLDPAEALRLALDVARRLAEVHARGLVHNNVHAEHVVLRAEPLGSGGRRAARARMAASLVSFSLSCPAGAAPRLDWLPQGPRHHLAPELLRGAACSPAGDVFSLGRLLAGLTGNRGPDHSPLQQLATHMTQRSPARRPSLACVTQRLEALLHAGHPRPPSPALPGLSRWLRACGACVGDTNLRLASNTPAADTRGGRPDSEHQQPPRRRRGGRGVVLAGLLLLLTGLLLGVAAQGFRQQ